MNTKALPRKITRPIILFVLKSYGETIYIIDPKNKRLNSIYTEEEGIFTVECSEAELDNFRKKIMDWHYIAKKRLLSYPSGKILHWEYL